MALDISSSELRELAIEAKLEKLGLSDPTFTLMMKEIPKMTTPEKESLVKAYEAVIEARKTKRKRRTA